MCVNRTCICTVYVMYLHSQSLSKVCGIFGDISMRAQSTTPVKQWFVFFLLFLPWNTNMNIHLHLKHVARTCTFLLTPNRGVEVFADVLKKVV